VPFVCSVEAYDDNPPLFSTGALASTSGSVFPNLSIEQTRSRTRWTLGYAGGLTVNQRLTSQNQGSHDLSFDSQFRLSPHVNLRAAEDFSVLTGVFDPSGSGGPNGGPLATQKSSLTTVETDYHFALNDLVGASGSFHDLHFSVSGGEQLSNSQTATVAAFWLHKMLRGNWGGVSYRFQRIAFDPNSETRVHNFMFLDVLRLSNHWNMSGFVGPEYEDNYGVVQGATQLSHTNQWSVAGGADGGWQNEKTSFTAGYSRSISNGAGVLGAVRLENVHVNFRGELRPGWAATLMASHGTNNAITVSNLSKTNSLKLTSAGVGLERNVGKGLGLRLSYTHDFQQEFGLSGTAQSLDAHRNRFAAILSYQWSKPLGM
jgi:hypothetical protein